MFGLQLQLGFLFGQQVDFVLLHLQILNRLLLDRNKMSEPGLHMFLNL